MLASLGITTTSALGAVAFAVIGLANIGGTIAAGALGQHYQKKYLLAQIYLARTVVAAAFILAPITPASVLVFSVLMGALWLATVPLTSGLVAQIWGLRYMGTLYGLVFFSHQLGGFLGVWLGGRLYDLYGNYTLVWWVGRRRRGVLGARPPADPRAAGSVAGLGRLPRATRAAPGARVGGRGATGAARSAGCAERGRYQLAAMYLVSQNSRMPWWPPSRPRPLCLTPPNGAAGSEIRPRFSPTMPHSSFSETRSPRARSPV